MKKVFMVLIVGLLALGLVGCGGESGTADSGGDAAPASSDNASTAKAEITQTAFSVWKDSIDTVWGHGAVEIKNTGDIPIRIGDIAISFVGADGTVLGSLSAVLPVPEVLQPGEIAYAGDSTTLEGVAEAEDIKNIEANIDFDATEEKSQTLEVQDLKVLDGGDYSVGPKVTGRVNNVSDKNADDIRIAIGLLDGNKKLLGVLTATQDVTLAPEKAMGFDTAYPEIKLDESKVKEVIGKSFNWSFE